MLQALLLPLLVLAPCVRGQYDYAEVLEKSILFYEVQRSGPLPGNNRIPWRDDSAVDDGSDVGLDLTGGWYDAGDHVKFNFPMAYTTTVLAWSLWAFRGGYGGQAEIALDSIKWPLDYFIKCHPDDNTLYAQVGDGYADHAYWGRPEQMDMARPSFKVDTATPGSDLAAETAAAMAAGSLAFANDDPAYSETLLDHARRLYTFAYNNRGLYSDSVPAGDFYGSSGDGDELAWGAVWLYHATGEQQYLDYALEFYSAEASWAFSWDNKNPGTQVLMYKATQDSQYSDHVKTFLQSWYPGGQVQYTPQGLAWRDAWGSLRYAASTAAIALFAHNEGITTDTENNLDWARGQMHYILGTTGMSFVQGYGNTPPERSHHRAASCNPDFNVPCNWDDYNSPDANDNVLNGALVGGPDQNDYWEDDRSNFQFNEVACDYNSGFQAALAGLLFIDGGGDTTTTDSSTTSGSTESTSEGSTTSTEPGSTTSAPEPKYNYEEALEKSILFYEAERSGDLPDDKRIPWRDDSAMGDGSDVGLDLVGGWYDAGDHVKFNFPMAYTTTVLAWSLWAFRGGYEAAGQAEIALDSIKWPLDYFIKCHPDDNTLWGQVGDGDADHAYWGRPEQMDMARPSHKIDTAQPGSDLAAETAAAMAAGSLAFADDDPDYAATLLEHARSLYTFAYDNRGKYSDWMPGEYYGSTAIEDELAWGAVWLYHATGEQQYLDFAQEFYSSDVAWAFSWDDKNAGVQVLMYKATQEAQYSDDVKAFLASWYPGGDIPYTPLGLAWRNEWGSLRYSASTAAIALLAYNEGITTSGPGNVEWARGQLDYMLGDGGRSFVQGFGDNPPQRSHHRAASCNPDFNVPCNWDDFYTGDPNDSILNGALVGGPDQNDYYVDDRTNYEFNEVACDYNSGFQTALAGLLQFSLQEN